MHNHQSEFSFKTQVSTARVASSQGTHLTGPCRYSLRSQLLLNQLNHSLLHIPSEDRAEGQ